MTISFIVPLFRGEKFVFQIINNIERMIGCLENKDEYKIELILVNDEPNVKIEKSEEVSHVENVIIYNNRKNIGIHASRIKGLELSSGNYVCFLDQDDYLDISFAKKMLFCALETKADVVLCNGKYRNNRKIYNNAEEINIAISNKEYFNSLVAIISPGQALIKKEAIPNEWINFPLKGNYCDDAFLWMLLKNKKAKFEFVDEILYYHNEDGQNQSFKWNNNAIALEELKAVITTNNLLCKEYLDDFLCTVNSEISKHRFYASANEKIKYYRSHLDELEQLLQKYKVKKLGIYGYGIIGKALFEVAKKIEIENVIAIDKNLKHAEEVELYSLYEIIESENLENVNDYSVIVTVGNSYEDIKNELLKVGFKNIYSMKELLIDHGE